MLYYIRLFAGYLRYMAGRFPGMSMLARQMQTFTDQLAAVSRSNRNSHYQFLYISQERNLGEFSIVELLSLF